MNAVHSKLRDGIRYSTKSLSTLCCHIQLSFGSCAHLSLIGSTKMLLDISILDCIKSAGEKACMYMGLNNKVIPSGTHAEEDGMYHMIFLGGRVNYTKNTTGTTIVKARRI